jgi:formate/nitrite transporter FocA (FNT family)
MDRSEDPGTTEGAPARGKAVADIFSTDEIFHRVVATAREEFSCSNTLLFLSGLAAGLSMSLSLVGAATLETAWSGPNARAVGTLLYPLGFLFVVLGRYQLFTENTLTPVTLVLIRLASIPRLLRIWAVVLTANLLGTGLAAWVLAETPVFSAAAADNAMAWGHHLLGFGTGELFWKGLFAGWLVATMVWLGHAIRESAGRILMIWAIVLAIGYGELAHCIVGACEVLLVVFHGGATMTQFAVGFLLPTLLGNTLGGVLLVAMLNYSQISDDVFPGTGERDRDWHDDQLGTREWLTGRR